jgi:hypothetical protein
MSALVKLITLNLALSFTACGPALLSSVLDTSQSNEGSKSTLEVTEGTYSFVYTDSDYTCTDGSAGKSLGGALQMTVNVSDGFIDLQQTAVSSGASVQKSSTIGPRVISSTPASGTVNNTGEFSTTSVTVFDDPKYGLIRITYRISGQFKGKQWSGTYEMRMFVEDLGSTCNYKSYFSGSLQN